MKKRGKCYIICPFDSDLSLSGVSVSKDDFVICADASCNIAEAHGLSPDLIIGDFDSGSRPENAPCETIEYSAEKDDTDTMLCLKKAIELGFSEIVIVGGVGGRLDHTLANISALLYADECGVTATLKGSENTAFIARDEERIPKSPGSYLSLFSVTSAAEVSLKGTKYGGAHTTILRSFPLGVSNEITSDEAVITVHTGKVLCVVSKK